MKCVPDKTGDPYSRSDFSCAWISEPMITDHLSLIGFAVRPCVNMDSLSLMHRDHMAERDSFHLSGPDRQWQLGSSVL